MRIRNIIIALGGALVLAGCAYDDYGYGFDDGYYHHHHHHYRDYDDYWGGDWGR